MNLWGEIIMNKEIRSKNTYQKGKILKITSHRVYVSFVKEAAPISITFEQFLKNCWCDVETENYIKELQQKEIEESNTLPNISK